MPRRPHGSDEPGPRRSRGHAAAHSVRGGEDAVEELARTGRAGQQGDHFITRTTGEPGGTPTGHPTTIDPDDDYATRLSIERENAVAPLLADRGHLIKQNPTADEVASARAATGDTGNPHSKPDYLIEGRVFDCYSPTNPTKSPRGIWSAVVEKVVVKKQTQRVVVDLEHWQGDMSALRTQFHDWPIEGLKEVKVITPDGDIVQIAVPLAESETHGD